MELIATLTAAAALGLAIGGTPAAPAKCTYKTGGQYDVIVNRTNGGNSWTATNDARSCSNLGAHDPVFVSGD